MNAQEKPYAVNIIKELDGLVQELPSQYVTPIMGVACVPVVWTVRGVSEEARRRSKITALMTSLPMGEFVDRALLAAVQGGIEAMRRRATATPKGKEGKIWTIRGVQPETRRLSRIAALKLGWTVGEFVDRALLAATEQLQGESAYPLKQTA